MCRKKPAILFFFVLAISLCTAVAFAQQTKGPGFSAPAIEGQWYDKSVAFVVGINSYSHGWRQLSNAVSDGKKMAKALRVRGFTVYELYNKQATATAIVTQLRKAAQQTGPNDRFLFFYSGHGHIQKAGFDASDTGFLVPVEGRSGDTTSYIPMEQLKMELTYNSKAKHTLLILDSCYSGLALTRSNIPTGPVSEYLNKRGIYGITAGMPNHKAVDGLFTDKFLEGLEGNADTDGDGFLTFKELGAYTEKNVKFKNKRQIPVYDVMAGAGQFVFASNSSPPPLPSPSPTYTSPKTDYKALAQQEERQREAQEKANSEARKQAATKAFVSLRDEIKQNKNLSLNSKKKAYKIFLSDYPTDNPHSYEVNKWVKEPEKQNVEKKKSSPKKKKGFNLFKKYPEEEMAYAEMSVTEAKAAGAHVNCPDRYAAAEMRLASAKAAADEGDYDTAKEMANEAVILANVAQGCPPPMPPPPGD